MAARRRAPVGEPPSLAAAASIVALGFLGSRLLGLVRTVVIAHQFGTSPELDAYFVAFRLPDLIFQLLAGATLAAPSSPRSRASSPTRRRARGLAAGVERPQPGFGATLFFAVVGLLLAPVIVPLTAPGLGDDTGQQAELTSSRWT